MTVKSGPLEPGTSIAADEVVVPWLMLSTADGGEAALSTYVALASVGPAGGPAAEVGVWDHQPGVSEDVEVDEVFVVISGAARIDFLDPALPALEIGPGDIVRLPQGAHTRWTITEHLRKVYVTMESNVSRPDAAQEGIPA